MSIGAESLLAHRVNAIILLASSLAKDNYTKNWLKLDERGTWRAEAAALINDLSDAGKARPIEEQNDAIARRLVYMALTAQINVRTKRKR